MSLKLTAEGSKLYNAIYNTQYNKLVNVTTHCLVISQILGKLPKSYINTKHLNLSSIELADPLFYKPFEMGLLIGADILWDLIGYKQHTLRKCIPHLRE